VTLARVRFLDELADLLGQRARVRDQALVKEPPGSGADGEAPELGSVRGKLDELQVGGADLEPQGLAAATEKVV